MLNSLKAVFFKVRWTLKRDVKFSWRVKVDRASFFSRNTAVYSGSDLRSTYLGTGSYVGPGSDIRNSLIGSFSSIGPRTRVVQGLHPTSKFVSTHPSFYSTKCQSGFSFVDSVKFEEEAYTKNDVCVEIGSDVWIGSDVIILAGVTIGDGAIVGTGSLVTKDIEPFAIVRGVPARVSRFRFSTEDIELLNKVQWWKWDNKQLFEVSEYMVDIEFFKKKFQE